MPTKECEYCGEVFISDKSYQKYCSPKCCRLAQPFYRNRETLNKRCIFCGQDYLTTKRNQKYCSHECQLEANKVASAKYKERVRTTPLLKLRFEVFLRNHFRCSYCGRGAKDGVTLVVDHIIPESRGGKTELGNLTTACQECNQGKSDIILDFHAMGLKQIFD